jgi:multidrug efflux pump subunit AcrA (membrane-fusion protein)
VSHIITGTTASPDEASADRASAVGARGCVEPESGLININVGTPDVRETLLVHRGDTVKEGQVLGYLQSYAVEMANCDVVAAQLAEAKARLATTVALDEARIQDAQIKLDQVVATSPLQLPPRRSSCGVSARD